MRWKTEVEPKLGDKRVIERFALFPRTVGDTTVWLERYISYQEFGLWSVGGGWGEYFWQEYEAELK
jgi:hypothetical protein